MKRALVYRYEPRWFDVYGDDSLKANEIDLVAVRGEDRPIGSRSCGPYRKVSGGGAARVTATQVATDVTVYDRRTGAQVVKREFAGTISCPDKFEIGESAELSEAELEFKPSAKEIADFLRGIVGT